MVEDVRICGECIHIRHKPAIDPFATAETMTPEQIKLRSEWQQKRTEVALQEQHRFRAGEEFDYEPETLPWCKAWTETHGSLIDPVTGNKSSIYALCARENSQGSCALFVRK